MFCLIVIGKVFYCVLCTREIFFSIDFLIHCCCFPMIRLQITIPVATQLTRYSTGSNLQYGGVFQADSNSCDLDPRDAEGRVRHGSAFSGS